MEKVEEENRRKGQQQRRKQARKTSSSGTRSLTSPILAFPSKSQGSAHEHCTLRLQCVSISGGRPLIDRLVLTFGAADQSGDSR